MTTGNQLKFDHGSGSTVTVTLKSNALNLFIEPENNLWTYDLKGRLIGVYFDSKNYRRTLDNSFYLKSREIENSEIFRNVTKISPKEAQDLVDIGIQTAKTVLEKVPDNYAEILTQIIDSDFSTLEVDGKLFQKIYLPISILPPDQYLSLVIQISEGCNYNKCTFCDFYRDRPFRLKLPQEFEEHLKNVSAFFGPSLSLRRSVFLADANAMVTPMKKLVPALKLVEKSFPHIKDIYSFIDVFTGIKKSVQDYEELKKLGIHRVYLGVESGHRPLLDFLNKHQDIESIVELSQNLKKAGIKLGVIFLVGAGGQLFADSHRNDSIELLKRLSLSSGDMVYLSEFYETNKEYRSAMENEKINIPDRLKVRQWANEMKKGIRSAVSKEVKVAVYDIQQFFY